MQEILASHAAVIQAAAAVAALFIVQLLVADAAAILGRHVPGTPVTGGHDSFLFRSTRAHANTVENLAAFALAVVLVLVTGADPRWSGIAAWTFAAARAGHMVFYYADWRVARSVAFSIGVLALAVLVALAGFAAFR